MGVGLWQEVEHLTPTRRILVSQCQMLIAMHSHMFSCMCTCVQAQLPRALAYGPQLPLCNAHYVLCALKRLFCAGLAFGLVVMSTPASGVCVKLRSRTIWVAMRPIA